MTSSNLVFSEFESQEQYYSPITEKFARKECFIIKQITKQEIQKLLDAGILRNTHRGYVNRKGNEVGYYRTTGVGKKRYIEDWYANKAQKLQHTMIYLPKLLRKVEHVIGIETVP